MMRLLLDINVLLDVVFQRPGEKASSALIARIPQEHEAWVAWHSLATLAYLIERERSADEAREFLRGLLDWAKVAPTCHADAVAALAWPMADIEDALQAAAAKACDAQFIVTRNLRDYKHSAVPALTPEATLRRFAGTLSRR